MHLIYLFLESQNFLKLTLFRAGLYYLKSRIGESFYFPQKKMVNL